MHINSIQQPQKRNKDQYFPTPTPFPPRLQKQASTDMLIAQIKEKHNQSKSLDTDPQTFKAYLQKTEQFSQSFLQQLPYKKTDQKEDPNYFKNNQKNLEISQKTESFDQILQIFQSSIIDQGYLLGHPGFMGYFSGGGLQTAALAEYINQLVNPQAGLKKACPGAHQIEKLLIEWTAETIGYPKQNCGGNFTTGGSMSHLSAICAARDAHNISAKDYERCAVYLTSQTHLSFQKSLNVAGMRDSIIRIVDIDPISYKMDSEKLKIQLKQDLSQGILPLMVVGSAGATSTGQIDPLEQIGKICEENHIWFHVDGAYGGYFAICEEGKRRLKGIEMSDSVILDPHKTLSMPLGLGLILVKNLKYLQKTFGTEEAYYLQDSCAAGTELDYPEIKDLSNELSRSFRGFKLWMALKLHGVDCFVANLEEKLLLTRYFVKKLKQMPNIHVVMKPDLSTVCFRYQSEKIQSREEQNMINKKLNEMIQKNGEILLSSTVLDDQITLRIAILSFRTHIQQIDICLNNLQHSLEILNNVN